MESQEWNTVCRLSQIMVEMFAEKIILYNSVEALSTY